MHAAVVHSYAEPPRYETFAEPASRAGEVIVSVRAAAASQLARAIAGGKHYSNQPGELPFVPGFDGVGTVDGARVYFAGVDRPFGALAERAPVARVHTTAIPDGVDDVTAAAIANPGMSAWAALTVRASFARGEAVLVNGATGASGRLAVQIAKHLGARAVIATGRNPRALAELPALGADQVLSLAQPPDELRAALRGALAEHRVDVVLDYLWGPPAEALLAAIGGGGHGAQPRIRFVQIGAMAGAAIPLPAGLLRSTRLELLGSGLGAVPIERLVTAIGEMFQAVVPARLAIATATAPLAEIGAAWTRDVGDRRLVLTMR